MLKTYLKMVANVSIAMLISSCANTLNQATSNQYGDDCYIAESRGQLEVAEQACYRALVNVDWGNLGPEQKSQRLYNLARIKRRLSKFSEAENLLKQSLSVEEKTNSPLNEIIGRRLVELSVNLATQGKWDEGTQFLDRVIPISNQYYGQERAFLSNTLSMYGKEFRQKNRIDLADRYEAASVSLK